MNTAAAALADPVRLGLVGAGRIGTSHATLLAWQVPGAKLLAVADPDIEAVVITAASPARAELDTAVVVGKVDPR